MIKLNENAAKEIKKLIDKENNPKLLLRILCLSGGCSGLSYHMKFDDTINDKDNVLEAFGIKVVIDPKSTLFLKGLEIDYTDGLDGKGFVFTNPMAKQTCGCGSSFSA